MVCETSGAQSPLQWSFLRNTQNLTSSAFLLLLRSRGHGVDALVSARACHMSRAFALERGAWSGAALDWPLAAAEAGGRSVPVAGRGRRLRGVLGGPPQCRRPGQRSLACPPGLLLGDTLTEGRVERHTDPC